MLFLIFQLGKDRYALEAGQVAEVLPLIDFKRIPNAPPGVAGVFNYHGVAVPLIDLTELALGRSSQVKMSTRIVLIHYLKKSGQRHLLGLIAESVTETLTLPEGDFVESGVTTGNAPYLGSVMTSKDGIIQRIDSSRLLPQDLQEQLFCGLVDSAQ